MNDAPGQHCGKFPQPESSLTCAEISTHGAHGLTSLASEGACKRCLLPQYPRSGIGEIRHPHCEHPIPKYPAYPLDGRYGPTYLDVQREGCYCFCAAWNKSSRQRSTHPSNNSVQQNSFKWCLSTTSTEHPQTVINGIR